MHIPLRRRARSLRELIQHHVRLSLADNHTATSTAAREALLLRSAMTAPPSTPADTSIDAEPPNVVVSSALVTTLTQTPPRSHPGGQCGLLRCARVDGRGPGAGGPL
jgi:hypothetical protein